MTTTRARRTARRQPGRALKSPLAVPRGNPASRAALENAAVNRPGLAPRTLRLTEFADHLRITNSPKAGRPYEESTIVTYVYPAKALDAWMTAADIDGDFTVVDTRMLNRYFRDY